jgi:hypothetical protein
VQDREIFPCLQGNLSLSCTICRCLILYLTFISSCALFDSYVLLADDHVNKVSYFSFMSIKKVIPYFCVSKHRQIVQDSERFPWRQGKISLSCTFAGVRFYMSYVNPPIHKVHIVLKNGAFVIMIVAITPTTKWAW